MNPLKTLNTPHLWLTEKGRDNDVVISSRVRLARNVADAFFPARSTAHAQRQLLDRVLSACKETPVLCDSLFVDLNAINKTERQFLMERHLISLEMAFESDERGVLVAPSQQISLMINEEDHLRLQSFEPGLQLRAAWKRADRIDTHLGERLPLAYDSEWGYCSRCPTNAGTGLRASTLLHLAGLVLNGDIERVLEALGKMGVTARGFYGERSRAFGDLFQVSNATSLGQSEVELVENVERVAETVVRYERQARQALMDERRRTTTEDAIFRSLGILRHARRISYDEAMGHLSRVQLGLQMGLEVQAQRGILNELMITTQPAHLQICLGGAAKADERDKLRATLIREKLSGETGSSGKSEI